ncbi:MAG: DUF2721 domain-containing protein [bacterium]|nr:DUF2721 domain-containing protein [bacterium]
MQQTGSVVAIIAQMITPAIFILACGNLVASTMSRVARVVDRSRLLLDESHAHTEHSEAHTFITTELDVYKRRAVLLENALTLYYSAIGTFVLASLFVALSALIAAVLWVPTALTVFGAVLVLFGALASLREVRLATGTTRKLIDRAL